MFSIDFESVCSYPRVKCMLLEHGDKNEKNTRNPSRFLLVVDLKGTGLFGAGALDNRNFVVALIYNLLSSSLMSSSRGLVLNREDPAPYIHVLLCELAPLPFEEAATPSGAPRFTLCQESWRISQRRINTSSGTWL